MNRNPWTRALVDNGFATGGLAVDNDKAVVHRARLCPQGAQARKPISLLQLYS